MIQYVKHIKTESLFKSMNSTQAKKMFRIPEFRGFVIYQDGLLVKSLSELLIQPHGHVPASTKGRRALRGW